MHWYHLSHDTSCTKLVVTHCEVEENFFDTWSSPRLCLDIWVLSGWSSFQEDVTVGSSHFKAPKPKMTQEERKKDVDLHKFVPHLLQKSLTFPYLLTNQIWLKPEHRVQKYYVWKPEPWPPSLQGSLSSKHTMLHTLSPSPCPLLCPHHLPASKKIRLHKKISSLDKILVADTRKSLVLKYANSFLDHIKAKALNSNPFSTSSRCSFWRDYINMLDQMLCRKHQHKNVMLTSST